MSKEELTELISNYKTNARGMNLSPDVLKKWNDLDTTIQEAEQSISTSFINQMGKLTPGFGALAKSLTAIVEGALKEGGTVDMWLRSAAHGLGEFSEALKNGEFKKGEDDFIEGVNKFVAVVMRLPSIQRGGERGFFGGPVPEGYRERNINRRLNKLFGIKPMPGDDGAYGDDPHTSNAIESQLGREGREQWKTSPLNKNHTDRVGPVDFGGDDRLSIVGHAKSAGIENVDPRLVKILHDASKDLPKGWRAELYSGYRAGDTRLHGRGMASDVRILDDKGNPLANYQDPKTFRVYEKFAQSAKKYQKEDYPSLDKDFRWGGYFGGPPGKYGAMDEMHFDIGNHGAMAGGSFEKGLTPAQRSIFPGIQSEGMGDIDSWKHPAVQAEKAPPPPAVKDRTLANYMAAHPSVQHWNREAQKPKITVDAPQGMEIMQGP